MDQDDTKDLGDLDSDQNEDVENLDSSGDSDYRLITNFEGWPWTTPYCKRQPSQMPTNISQLDLQRP